MKLISTEFYGCYLIHPNILQDTRGSFIKTYNKAMFNEWGIESDFDEGYYTISNKNVIRGLHFQLPPKDHAKLVYCAKGKVMDVVVDLRVDSSTFGQHTIFYLSSENGKILYIPPGLAHGFCAMEDNTIMMYSVTTVYSTEHDYGIRWDSVGIQWPVCNPVLSTRDKALPSFADFSSPFKLK